MTPLKPYEAFATGRTVILSNVRALAALAHDSGAAELFEAGDEASLAEVLLALLADPARRRRLAEAGAEWVRSHASWAANAVTYRSLYAELGAIAGTGQPDQSGGADGSEFDLPRPTAGESGPGKSAFLR